MSMKHSMTSIKTTSVTLLLSLSKFTPMLAIILKEKRLLKTNEPLWCQILFARVWRMKGRVKGSKGYQGEQVKRCLVWMIVMWLKQQVLVAELLNLLSFFSCVSYFPKRAVLIFFITVRLNVSVPFFLRLKFLWKTFAGIASNRTQIWTCWEKMLFTTCFNDFSQGLVILNIMATVSVLLWVCLSFGRGFVQETLSV